MRFLFIHDIFYARILYMLHKKMLGVAQKTMQCRQKILPIEATLRTKIM